MIIDKSILYTEEQLTKNFPLQSKEDPLMKEKEELIREFQDILEKQNPEKKNLI